MIFVMDNVIRVADFKPQLFINNRYIKNDLYLLFI